MLTLGQADRVLQSVPGDVVAMLRRVDLGAGSEALHRNQVPELLASLALRARGESITASSAIEGVTASPQRAQRIIDRRAATLRTRDEQQLAGYRESLDYLFNADWRPVNVGLLLHLHRLLWSHTSSRGGYFKTQDNPVVDRSPDGSVTVRFRPVPAAQTEFHVSELVSAYTDSESRNRHHPVLRLGLFVLDLTVIHPFEDGNGRVARVLSNALLDDAGYHVGRWISLEQLIADSADEYYSHLLASTHGWLEGTADVWPWLRYFVSVIATAYERFARRITAERTAGSKQDRVRTYVLTQAPRIFRIADVRAAVPGVSDNTIRLVLNALKRDRAVLSDGTGRSATWRKSQ